MAGRLARTVLIGTGLAAFALPAAPAAGCADMTVGAADLEAILDQTLGGLRALVDQRSVTIDPDSSACYVRMNLSSSLFAQSGGACRLAACSAVVARGSSLALREFDVAGCDPLFNGLGLSRHVQSTFVDASGRIREHCGSSAFEFDRIAVVRGDGEARLRFGFRPAAAQR